MNLEFAQSAHDAIGEAFAEKLALAQKSISFHPSQLQVEILQSFRAGRHRLAFFVGDKRGCMGLAFPVADKALKELVEHGYLSVLSDRRDYTILVKGRAYLVQGEGPKLIATPPRTFTNSTPTTEPYSLPKMNLRAGWDDHLMIKSLPMGKQLQMVVA